MDRSNTPILAGVISLIGGAFGLLGGVMCIGVSLLFIGIAAMPGGEAEDAAFLKVFMLIYVSVGVVFFLAGILAIIGSIFAFKRRYWGWALAGAIASVITFFPIGVAAVVFTAQSRSEFDAPPSEAAPEATSKPFTGGVLLLVSSGLSVLGAAFLIAYATFLPGMFDSYPFGDNMMDSMFNVIAVFYWVFAVIVLIAAVLAFIGGRHALKRRSWGWALTGSIAAVVGFMPLGVAAIILVAQAKDEFVPQRGDITV